MLDQIIVLLRRAPDTPIEIASHTDTVGEAEYNMQLSRRRAEAVKQLDQPRTHQPVYHDRLWFHTASLPGEAATGPQRNERIELLM